MIPHWKFAIVEVPITVTLDAYTANDVVGGTLTSNEIPQLSGGGMLAWVRLVDDATQAEPYLLYVYSAVPSVIANDAAFAPTEADNLLCLGCISIEAADYDTSGSEADMAFVAANDRKTTSAIAFDNLPTGRLYLRLVAVDTPDYADANDLTLHLGMWVA